jgi:hypothetical protein
MSETTLIQQLATTMQEMQPKMHEIQPQMQKMLEIQRNWEKMQQLVQQLLAQQQKQPASKPTQKAKQKAEQKQERKAKQKPKKPLPQNENLMDSELNLEDPHARSTLKVRFSRSNKKTDRNQGKEDRHV